MKKAILIFTLVIITLFAVVLYLGDQINYEVGLKAYNEGDFEEALSVFTIVAKHDQDVRAQHALSIMYKRGEGTEIDVSESEKYNLLAANNGHKNSQYLVGMDIFINAKNQNDYLEAEKWLVKSAN